MQDHLSRASCTEGLRGASEGRAQSGYGGEGAAWPLAWLFTQTHTEQSFPIPLSPSKNTMAETGQ